MLIVDRALERRAAERRPVRFAMVGAGFMGQALANQVVNATPGMELVAICNRHLEGARRAYREAGVDDVVAVDSPAALDREVARGKVTITEDPSVVCRASSVEAVVEVTGAVEFGAHVALDAIEHRKHLILMNAELDGTVGPLLKVLADEAGVIVTACDGDQPGVEMNLYRFLAGIGITPLLCGNIKGLQDRYRNPTTQKSFAERWGQDPHMVTSFADGTKVSFEQALVANATGMTVARRGMYGHDWTGHIDDAVGLYDVDELRSLGGIVDYVVGAKPGPGIYVFGTHDDPKQRHYLELYKLGAGPLYSFYTPYHLCHFEVPTSVARAVLFADPVMQPAGGPRVEIITRAKTDLAAGTILDRIGGYHSYGECERADVTATEDLLPIGVAEGCTLVRSVPKDHCLTYADVTLPPGRLIDDLRRRQAAHFHGND
jgi:predicted homoserine dehydrogenase-like protein